MNINFFFIKYNKIVKVGKGLQLSVPILSLWFFILNFDKHHNPQDLSSLYQYTCKSGLGLSNISNSAALCVVLKVEITFMNLEKEVA